MKITFNPAGVRPHVKKCTFNQGPPLKKLTFFLAVLFSSMLSLQAFAQKQITGTVVDKQKLPLPGATIKIKGTTTAVASDMNGKFKISVPGDNAVLTVTSIGFTPKDVAVGTQTDISVTLLEESRGLNTVVVVGYGSQKKGEITSATGHADTSDFRQSGARNPMDLIQGKIAGLQISRSGSNPNTGTSIQLRGVTTLTGSASPLVVIDGIPGGNLDLLQQDDIASIDVLKDGSGAAIYGTTANAGVILVTTKKGKEGPAQFTYSNYFRKEYLARIPRFLTADEFRQKIQSGQYGAPDNGSSNDFFDQLVNHGNLSQNHNFAMTGGTSKTNYRASINYRDLQGFAKENGRKEYSVRLSVNQKGLDDKLNVAVNLAGNFADINLLGGDGWEDVLRRNPTLSNYNADGTYLFQQTSTNQFARLQQETNKRQQNTISADGKVDYEFIPGLKGSVFGSVQRNNYVDGLYRSIFSEFSLENEIYKGGGYAERTTQLNISYAFEPTIQYTKVIADDHNLTAIFGYSFRQNTNEGFSAGNYGFLNDRFMENNLGAGSQLQTGKAVMSSFKNQDRLIAFFGRVNYAYKDKYLLQASLRREGSTRFGDNNKWGYFPAVSAGWTISEEEFMKDVNFVNNLKIRAGYGITGNSGFQNNASRVTLGTGGIYRYPDGEYRETYGPDRNANPNLRFEKKQELNIGADFTLFNNRISGSLDLFQRKTVDLLDSYTTPQPPYVRDNIYANVGTISAKGIELAVSFAAIKYQGFTWSMDVAASTARNTLDSYSDDIFKVEMREFGDIGGAGALGRAIRTYEGGPLGQFWGKRFAGFTDQGTWLFYTRNGDRVANGQINNSPYRDQTDLAPIGNAIPKYYLSWTNNFKYKQFDVRVFMRSKLDFDILNTTALTYGNKRSGGNLLADAFTKYSQIDDTYMYSDYYVENGSFLKIDEITFGYTFKLKTKKVRSLRAYVTGQNLVTFTSYSGNDPDFVSDSGTGPGIDTRSPYPSTRSFLLGLSFGF